MICIKAFTDSGDKSSILISKFRLKLSIFFYFVIFAIFLNSIVCGTLKKAFNIEVLSENIHIVKNILKASFEIWQRLEVNEKISFCI